MINKVVLMGRTTRDLELRTSSNNNFYVTFALAVNRYVPNSQGEEETDFIECIAYGKNAENLCKYVKKGHRLLVEGAIRVSSVTKPDNTRLTTTKVEVKTFEFIEKREYPNN